MKKLAVVSGATVLAIAIFLIWYSIAANYDYSALSGTYVFRRGGERCLLYLRPDRTFSQQIDDSGETQKTQGQWSRYGESHVSFSGDFLKLPGEDLNALGQAHGEFEKTLGIFPILVLAPLPDGPKFHRRLLH